MSKKRNLTKKEIDHVLDFIQPNMRIPSETGKYICEKTKKSLQDQLATIKIYPEMIERLKDQIKAMYVSTLVQPGESVGIITAQSIGEKQTQSNLNTFHKAGSSDKQPVVSKFSELLNATNKPKAPSYLIYFKHGNTGVPELRKTVGHSIVQFTLKKVCRDWEICMNKSPEPWYDAFNVLYGGKEDFYTDCISVKIDMDILYEYRLTLKEIADTITSQYIDSEVLFSPDCYGQLDIYFDTSNIDLPEEKLIFVTKENAKEIYLEEVVQPMLEDLHICGISGITNMFFVQEGKEWLLETENSTEKTSKKAGTKIVSGKEKPLEITKRFKVVLAHPDVDMTRTVSNNVWDIYHTFGIEAARQYMIDEYSKIMKGINTCHVMLLVDKMTFGGTISSISRYTMRREESGPFGKASFEETLDNFLTAGVYGQKEPTRGVSASIICGKRAPIGTGLCDLAVDINKLI